VTAVPAAAPHRSLRGRPVGLAAYYVGLIALLYMPIAILTLFSVNSGTSLVLPLRGLTLDWYAKVFQSPALLQSVLNSLIVAVASSVAATILGTMVALLLARYRFRAKRLLIGLAVLPLVVPFIVLAVALLIVFRAFNVELSLVTVAIAHTIVALPYTTLIIVARLIGFDASLEDAAMDLGATYPAALRLVVLPMIAPSVVSAALTAFTISFDEFALALFLAGKNPTFPVYLFGQLRFANTLPIIIALAVLLMIGTLGLVFAADRIRRIR
jgi:spermidine/putrescine transport system permease protein